MRSKTVPLFLRAALILVFLAGLLGNVTPASAALLCYVKHDASGDKDGTSWADAFTSLQSALGASPCTEVWVAKGTYIPTTDVVRTASFELKSGVKIYGGFAGSETVVGQRNPVVNVTILSGNIGDDETSDDNSYHVVYAGAAVTTTAVLDGFVIEKGNANGTVVPNERGGGIFIDGGDPTIKNVTIRNNAAKYGAGLFTRLGSTAALSYLTVQNNVSSQDGGGMYNSSSSPSLTHSLIKENTAQYGGAIYNDNSSPTIENVQISYNDASIYGAGMYSASSGGSLENVTFDHNDAAHSGGGMYNTGSNPSVLKVTFSTNTAVYYGGGMYNGNGSTPLVRSTVFTLNKASDWGGGMHNSHSNPTVRNVTFEANDAYAGGAIFNSFSDPTVTHSYIGFNTANDGAGIYNDSSNPTVENVTFRGNQSDNSGGAIANYASSPIINNTTISHNTATILAGGIHNNASTPDIRNTIVYSNSGGQIIDQNGSTSTISFTIVQGGCPAGATCASVTGDNPLLSGLGYHGGPTRNTTVKADSPAVDGGNNATCATSDQRGIARPQDGNGNGVATCDIGATEGRFKVSRFRSIAADDGFIIESAEDTGIGGSGQSGAEHFFVGDAAADQQYRAILSFNTAAIHNRAEATRVFLSVKLKSVAGTNPLGTHGNLLVDIRRGSFSDNVALELTDFQALSNLNAAGILDTPLPDNWHRSTLFKPSLRFINPGGITQFRLRFTLDDNDNAVADFLRFYSGDVVTVASRPELLVKYFIP